MTREERLTKNEALFREVNEKVKELTVSQLSDWSDVLCECSDPNCLTTIEVTVGEYEAVRAHGARFALAGGHEDTSVERVVERTERFVVVEKTETAGAMARDLDPRSENPRG
ncbi:MAG: hypothetical protein M3377_06835 [Actinomycetota bacterium]|nr:hypothetical protein [Actinomycetota bacterium]